MIDLTAPYTSPAASRRKWMVLGLAAMTMFCLAGVLRYCLPVLFDEIARDLDLSMVQIGAVWGMDPLGGIFVSLISGMLIDRFGIRRTISSLCVLAGLTGMARGLSTDFISLMGTMFLFGLVIASSPTLLAKVVAVWMEGRHLGMANGALIAFSAFGGMFSTTFSASLFSPMLNGWRPVMVLYGIPPLFLAAVWFLAYKDPDDASVLSGDGRTVALAEALAHVARIPAVWTIGLAQAGIMGAYLSFTGYLPVYLRAIGWKGIVADAAMTLMIAAAASGSLLLPLVSDRLGSRKVVLLPLTSVMFIAMIGLPLGGGIAIWGGIALLGACAGGAVPLLMTTVVEVPGIGGRFAGTAIGLSATLGMLGGFIGSPLGGSAAGIWSGAPFLVWGGMIGVAVIVLGSIYRQGNRISFMS